MFSRFVFLFFLLISGCASTSLYPDLPPTGALAADDFEAQLDFARLDWRRLNAAIFHASNEARRHHGRLDLRHHPVLEEAALVYARRSARLNFLAHVDPTDTSLKTPEDRVRHAGAANPMVSENLATAPGFQVQSQERVYVIDAAKLIFARSPGGAPIPRHTYASFARYVVAQWLASPGHRRNLLDPNARGLGCGVAAYDQHGMPSFVAVQNFQLYEDLRE